MQTSGLTWNEPESNLFVVLAWHGDGSGLFFHLMALSDHSQTKLIALLLHRKSLSKFMAVLWAL